MVIATWNINPGRQVRLLAMRQKTASDEKKTPTGYTNVDAPATIFDALASFPTHLHPNVRYRT
jgi:hypothetical protein